jgi:antagonist of KipI
MFRVISPGVQSLVQDLGRPGLSSIGVPGGGAADRLSLVVGNRLVGNPDGAPAVELAMLGLEAVFERDAIVCLAGSPAVASIEGRETRRFETWTPTRLHAGERLRIRAIGPGLRTYLCIAGGVRVPLVLGSASTLAGAGLGGFHGRALRAGDEIECGEPVGEPRTPRASLASWMQGRLRPPRLRVVEGVDAPSLGRESLDAILAASFTVGLQSNRVGLRLEAAGGVPEALSKASSGRMPSMGMSCGAIELPPGGEPLLLGVDHPTTGGYPVLACVIEADLPALGQLAPRDHVRFELVDRETALREAARLRIELEQESPSR